MMIIMIIMMMIMINNHAIYNTEVDNNPHFNLYLFRVDLISNNSKSMMTTMMVMALLLILMKLKVVTMMMRLLTDFKCKEENKYSIRWGWYTYVCGD